MLNDLFKKILALPDLQLPRDNWSELSDIIRSLPEKNIEKFKEYYKDDTTSPVIKLLGNSKLTAFLQSWFEMINALSACFQYLADTWLNIIGKPIAGEQLVPLLIELLPDDITQLKLVLKKLDHYAPICDTGEIGFAITNLYIAIGTKISENEAKDKPDSSMVEKQVLDVAIEIFGREQINQILPACVNYKIIIRDAFLAQYKIKNNAAYSSVLKLMTVNETPPDNQQLMDYFIEKTPDDLLDIKNPDACTLLLQKYIAMLEMYYSLVRAHVNSSARLDEFTQKFLHFENILTQNMDNAALSFLKSTTNLLGINHISNFLGWQSKEESFLEMARFFSRQNRTAQRQPDRLAATCVQAEPEENISKPPQINNTI
jgi:hypothetical protein